MKKLLSLLLVFCLCLTPVLAAEDAVPTAVEGELQLPSAWSVPYLADARALKLVGDDYTGYITSPITADQLVDMTTQVYAKLALLNGDQTAAPVFAPTGNTRGHVIYALGLALQASGFDAADCVTAMQKLGVLQGDGTSLALERICTYEEAMVMATRLVLAAYDSKNAGSKGLLWKAAKGENTVYLLGTAHMDRGNLYPFHQTLRNAIASADTVVLELDFQDQAGLAEFAAMQSYGEGDGLKNHIPAELYTRTVNAFAQLGLTEEQTNTFKPWALANTVTSLMASDETAGDAPLTIDLYVNALAANAGKTVTGAETYALQGGIFDTLSEDYQTAYLDSGVTMLEATFAPPADAPQEVDPELQAALDEQERMFTDMMTAWQTADLELFNKTYDKSAIVNSDDELNARLFTDRDPGMVKVAQSYLEKEGKNTAFLAFGAGHMVAPGGIVPELQKLGYTVEQVTDYQATPPTPSVLPESQPEPEVTEPTTITMTFAGNTILGTYPITTSAKGFYGYAATQSPDYFLAGVKGYLEGDDFTVLTLENVLSDRALKPVEKSYEPAYWYRSPASYADILATSSVEVASLSNNHTGDYGEEGLADTKAALEAAGLQWGNRDQTVYLQKDGYVIAVVCGGMWNATNQLRLIRQRLETASQYSHFQVVMFHGGDDDQTHVPEDWKVKACRALVDAGADLVIGGHPHKLQPKETYKGVDIIYSLGNFCYGASARPENACALYRLELTVENGALTAKEGTLIPCYVYTGKRNNFQPMVMADSPEKQAVLDFMNGLRKSPV